MRSNVGGTRWLSRPVWAVAGLLLGCGAASDDGEIPTASSTSGGQVAVPVAAPIAVGQRMQGELTTASPIDENGRRFQRFALTLARGQRVRLHAPAAPLDPVLRVTFPNGVVRENDDAFPHTLDAVVELTAPVDGTYEVTLTTAPIGQVGHYLLDASEPPAAARMTLGSAGLAADLGASGDRSFPGRSFYSFEAPGGAVVTLRVTSTAFDTVATVLGPGGEVWFNDDANDLGPDGSERPLDSTIVLAAPTSGVYTLVVGGYSPDARGAFRVRSSVRPPVVLASGETSPRGGFAGRNGEGRVLGLYAGITAYQGQSQLYGCADDARLLGEAMRASHVQRVDEQIVLTDGAATRAAFVAGIQDLARRAQPNDVVMVFFSGHGNVQPEAAGGTGPDELDGLDETIVFIDGSLTDDEVVRELGNIHASNVILALDSCHAGGFGDDWVRQPNRIGLFSSEADVLSDTAEPRGAGGYLSYYLRRGVLGHADAKPHDGVLHAGELTDYLLEGMVADHRRMNPTGDDDPAQNFVMQRGSVPWTDVLWVYPRQADLSMPEVPSLTLESPRP